MKHRRSILLAGIALLGTILMGCEKSENGKETPKDEPVKTFQVNGVEFKMIRVDGGTFTMGATPEQGENVRDNEKPVHEVTLSTYYIAETEVTLGLWKAIVGTEGLEGEQLHETQLDGELPVIHVDWNVFFNKFLPKLNELAKVEFTLPTEAQWEFAARGGNKSQGYRFSGSNDAEEVCNAIETQIDKLLKVKSLKPNELGIYDMSGNAYEICRSYLGTYQTEPATDPEREANDEQYVLRGGSYTALKDWQCHISWRNPVKTGEQIPGIRLSLKK